MKIIYKIFLTLLFSTFVSLAEEYPALVSHVNDYSGVLKPEEKEKLEAKLVAFEKETGNQIVILTVKSLNGDTKEGYANKVFKFWKLGEKNRNNGVLLLNATDEKKARIEVGYGLEGALPDATCLSIFRNDMSPNLKKQDFFTAYDLATTNIISATKGEYKSDIESAEDSKKGGMLMTCVFFAVILFLITAFLGEFHWLLGGIVGALGAVLIAYFLGTWIVALGIIGFLAGSASNAILTGMSNGSSGGYYGGGGGSSFGDSSGSDSSFSGGGGDSGGGGGGGDY
ncbi:MAG: TPM domain-containing protein [bacterium]